MSVFNMAEKEFKSLSDESYGLVYPEEKVKKAVKRLKEIKKRMHNIITDEDINEIFGEKLVGSLSK